MSKMFIVVGAGSMNGSFLYVPSGATVIAADGGLRHLKKVGVQPSLIIGDFDSLGYVPSSSNVISAPSEKDETDTMIAVKQALSLGADTIVIYGGLGGRFDHSIANLQTLKFIAENGARGYLVGDGTIVTAFMNGGICFDENISGFVSVFAVGGMARGVALRGLKYPLTNASLSNANPVGVSNEFIGIPSSVYVGKGCLLVTWNGESFIPAKYGII